MELFSCGTANPTKWDSHFWLSASDVARASLRRTFQQDAAPDASRPMHIETRLSLWDSQSWLSSPN